jgi:hypothetical protein
MEQHIQKIRKSLGPRLRQLTFAVFLLEILRKGLTMGKMLKTSAINRRCMYPDCTNLLSIYNHEDYCHIHREMMIPRWDQLPQGQKPKLLLHHKA